MNDRRTVLILGLWSALGLACGGGSPSPRPVSNSEKQAIESSPDSSLEKAGKELSAFVVGADVAGIEQLWLTPEHLEGCSVVGKELAEGEMTTFPEKQLQRLRDLAGKNFREGASLLHVNSWTEAEPKFLGGRLEGDACKAKAFGRVNVVVKPAGDHSRVIEHRFNAQLIGDDWHLYRYLPVKADCAKDKNAKKLGCQKLAEQGPATEPAKAPAEEPAPDPGQR